MPDIILLDIMMPEMNGIQVLEKLKSDTQTKNIPVLVLSNITESKYETHTITKPHRYTTIEIVNLT